MSADRVPALSSSAGEFALPPAGVPKRSRTTVEAGLIRMEEPVPATTVARLEVPVLMVVPAVSMAPRFTGENVVLPLGAAVTLPMARRTSPGVAARVVDAASARATRVVVRVRFMAAVVARLWILEGFIELFDRRVAEAFEEFFGDGGVGGAEGAAATKGDRAELGREREI